MTTEAPSLEKRFETLQRWVWGLAAVCVFLVAFIILSAPQVIKASTNAQDAADDAQAATTAAKNALAESQRANLRLEAQTTCLTTFANQMADALDRRQSDSIAYQKGDAAQDRVIIELFRTAPAGQEAVAQKYLRATIAKQKALAKIVAGREDKAYPKAPREVC